MARLKDDTKIQSIHDAACNLLLKKGFDGLKMADVAKQAKLATGTIYIYYKTKEDLINALFTAIKQEISNELLHPKNQKTDFFSTFKSMWFAYFNYCINKPQNMLFVEQFYHSGLLTSQTLTITDTLMQPVYKFIELAQKNDIVRNLDVYFIQAQIAGAIHEIVKVSLTKKAKLTKTSIQHCFYMAWNSIRK